MRSFGRISVAVFFGFFACATAFADPPGRVGRVAFLEGDVQFYSDTDPTWKPAYVNEPVTSLNSVFTGANGKAEIRISGTAIALAGNTQLDFKQLDDGAVLANVLQGSVSMIVRHLDTDGSFSVSSGPGEYVVLAPGRYRVDASNDSNFSTVSVFSGRVNAIASTAATPVDAGRALSIANGADGTVMLEPAALNQIPIDSWEQARDQRLAESESARYVSPNMTGYEELDANGRWDNDPTYGPVWYPTTYVAGGWVPYRNGHWVFVAPWGWTWVDDAPWGFAPFHYGRWIAIGPSWAWVPGTYIRRPVYAPALVGFVGGGSISLTVGGGPGLAVGWYPLAPWERFNPGYTQNVAYVRNVNNITIASAPPQGMQMVENNRISVNQMRGATVVSQGTFASSQPVARATLSVPNSVIAQPGGGAFPPNLPRPVMRSGAQPYTSGAPNPAQRPQVQPGGYPRQIENAPGQVERSYPRNTPMPTQSAPQVQQGGRGVPQGAAPTPYPQQSVRAMPAPGAPVVRPNPEIHASPEHQKAGPPEHRNEQQHE